MENNIGVSALAALVFYVGYLFGSSRGIKTGYDVGHEHGYAIGKLDGIIEELKARRKGAYQS